MGALVEDAACRYLALLGYRIFERNYTCRLGEIDVVAQEGDVLVFIEVRFRGKGSVELPGESLNRRKMDRLRLAIRHYLSERLGKEPPLARVDVCLARPSSECPGVKRPGRCGGKEGVPVPGLGFLRFEVLKGVLDFS